MERDADNIMEMVNDLQLGVRAIQSRLRLLETRLQDRAVIVGNDKGRTKTLRLSADGNTLEVTG